MLLTCNNCHNTYFMDEQVYAQQGGAMCEQCQQLLVPVPDQNQGQWNQQAQWQNQAEGSLQQSEWDAGASQGTGELPPTQWCLTPVQRADSQAGGEAQWGQQPGEAQWGQQSGGAQWGQQPGDIQWGQQPAGGSQWGNQDQWSQMADRPDDDLQVVNHNDASEKTMAIDSLDDLSPAGFPPKPELNPRNTGNDDWDAWKKSEEMPTGAVNVVKPPAPGKPNAHCIVVGPKMNGTGNENVTREIDAQMIQKLYGEKANPFKEFFKSIPMRFHIIAGSVVLVAVVALFVGNYLITKPAEAEKKFDEKTGDLVTDDTPAPVKSFAEIANEMKLLSSGFVPFDADDMTEGSIVAVTKTNGIVVNGETIGQYSLIEKGNIFSSGLAEVIKPDPDKIGKPVVILFDESMPMHAVYRTLYTFSVAVNEFSQPVYIGGTTVSGISMVDIRPCKWPDHELTTFNSCPSISVKLKIQTDEIVMSRPDEVQIPFKNEEDEDVDSLTSKIIGGNKVVMSEFQNEIGRMRSSKTEVLLSPDGSVSFGIFMQIVNKLRGHRDTPNVYHMYLNDVPTR